MAGNKIKGLKKGRKTLTPTLYIGIGGTGLETLKKLKEINTQTYGNDLPVVSYLSIDTRDNTEKQGSLAATELLDLTRSDQVRNAGEALQNLEKYYPHIHTWLPDVGKWGKFKNITQIVEGADQCRALGRFLFNLGVSQKIYPAINTAISSITSTGATELPRQGDNKPGINLGKGPDIFIIGSVCGGTGSGMFLDLAYLCRHIGRESGNTSLKVYGVLALPDLFATTETHKTRVNRANAYAALKELNHFTDTKEYAMEYGTSISVRFSQTPPFNHCFLLNTPNEENMGFGKDGSEAFDTAISMMANGVFCLSTSPAETSFAEYLTNELSSQSAYLENKAGTKYPAAFSSFGVASLVFPYEHYLNYCTCRRTSDILRLLVKSGDDIPHNSTRDFFDNFLSGLEERLRDGVDVDCNAWWQEARSELLTNDDRIAIKEDLLLSSLHSCHDNLKTGLDLFSEAIRLTQKNIAPRPEKIETYFRKKINQSGQDKQSLKTVLDTIQEIRTSLRASQDVLENKKTAYEQQKEQFEENFARLVDETGTDEEGKPIGEIKRLVDQSFVKDLFDWDKKEVLGELTINALRALKEAGEKELNGAIVGAALEINRNADNCLCQIEEQLHTLIDLVKEGLREMNERTNRAATIPVREGLAYNVLRKGVEGSADALYQEAFGKKPLSSTLREVCDDTPLYEWSDKDKDQIITLLDEEIKEEAMGLLGNKENFNVFKELKASGDAGTYIASNLMPASAAYISTNTLLDTQKRYVNLLTITRNNDTKTTKIVDVVKKVIRNVRDYTAEVDLNDPYTISYLTSKCFFPICSLASIHSWKMACDLIRESKENPCYTMNDVLLSPMKDITPEAKESQAVYQRAVYAFDLGTQLGFLCKKPKGRVYYYCTEANNIESGFAIKGNRGGRLATKEWLKSDENRQYLEELEKMIFVTLSNMPPDDFDAFLKEWQAFVNKAIQKSKKDNTWKTDGQPDYTMARKLPEVIRTVKEQKEATRL